MKFEVYVARAAAFEDEAVFIRAYDDLAAAIKCAKQRAFAGVKVRVVDTQTQTTVFSAEGPKLGEIR